MELSGSFDEGWVGELESSNERTVIIFYFKTIRKLLVTALGG